MITIAATSRNSPIFESGRSDQFFRYPPSIGDDGTVTFWSDYQGSDPVKNSAGFFVDSKSVLSKGRIPGPDGVYINGVSKEFVSVDEGQVFFSGHGSKLGHAMPFDDSAIFLGTSPIAIAGCSISNLFDAIYAGINLDSAVSSKDYIFSASIKGDAIEPGTSHALFDASGVLARSGSLVPGTRDLRMFEFHGAAINRKSDVRFISYFSDPHNDSDWKMAITSKSDLYFRTKQPVSGVPSAYFSYFENIILDDNENLYFRGSFKGDGIDYFNSGGIFRNESLIVRNGDGIRGSSDLTHQNIQEFSINQNGDIAFVSHARNSVKQKNICSMLTFRGADGHETAVVKTGEEINLRGEITKIEEIEFSKYGLNEKGETAFLLRLENGEYIIGKSD